MLPASVLHRTTRISPLPRMPVCATVLESIPSVDACDDRISRVNVSQARLKMRARARQATIGHTFRWERSISHFTSEHSAVPAAASSASRQNQNFSPTQTEITHSVFNIRSCDMRQNVAPHRYYTEQHESRLFRACQCVRQCSNRSHRSTLATTESAE